MSLFRKRIKVPPGRRVSFVSTRPTTIVSRGNIGVRAEGKPFKPEPNKSGWRYRAKQRARKAAKLVAIYAIIANGAGTIGRKIYRDLAKPAQPQRPPAKEITRRPAQPMPDSNSKIQGAARRGVLKKQAEMVAKHAKKSASDPNRAAGPNRVKSRKPKELPPELKANDYRLFRESQAKRFGIVLTAKAAGFKPSASLMREIKRVVSEKSKPLGTHRVLVYSIVEFESNFNPNAKSHKNAKGLGQLLDIQIRQLKKLGFEITNPYEISQDVEGIARSATWIWNNLKVSNSREAFLSLPSETQFKMFFTGYYRGLSWINQRGPEGIGSYGERAFNIFMDNFRQNPFK